MAQSSSNIAFTTVSEYYHTLESRLGYRLLLGGTRHFGFYTAGTWWPFPISTALRRMEEHLYKRLAVKETATLLDAGAGVGDVALYMAKKGANVRAIDLLPMHVQWAKQKILAHKADDRVQISQMSYQDLTFEDATFNGAYTMETLVHATDPDRAMSEIHRVLRPGGVVVHIEYEHDGSKDPAVMHKLERVNRYSSMPAFQRFTYGTIQQKLEETGFVDVEVQDLSENVLPMLRLFFLLAIVPYTFLCLLGLETHFVNAMAAVEHYRIGNHVRYVSVKARKPMHRILAGGQSQTDKGGDLRKR